MVCDSTTTVKSCIIKSDTEGYDSLHKAVNDNHLFLEVAKRQLHDNGKEREYEQLYHHCLMISKPIHPEAFRVGYSIPNHIFFYEKIQAPKTTWRGCKK